MNTRKFILGKYGLKEDPRHAQVTIEYEGRTLLGDVKAVRRDEAMGVTLLTVVHFCGETWPIEPHVLAVDVLLRD